MNEMDDILKKHDNKSLIDSKSDYSVYSREAEISFLPKPMFRPGPTFREGDLILNRYEVRGKELGGFGEIYHCYDRASQRDVALKTVITEKKKTNSIFYFYQEAFMRLKMHNHPNVLRLRLVEVIHGYPYLISNWIDGDNNRGNTLRHWLSKSRLTIEEVIRFSFHIVYGLQVCSEQLSTEQKEYVLGDLKPENIMISKEHIAILADFSLNSRTKGYESPEQLRGEPLTIKHDIFDFGIVLEEMLNNCNWENENSAYLRSIICKCKEKKPEDRYDSYEELLLSLQVAADKCKVSVPPPTKPIPPTKLDYLYLLYSQINLGIELSDSPPFTNRVLVFNMISPLSMAEFVEYSRIPYLAEYEAEGYRCNGDYEKARKKLNDVLLPMRHEFYYYISGKINLDENKIHEALTDFMIANKDSIHLLSLNLFLDTLLSFPVYTEMFTDFLKTLDKRLLNFISDNTDGYFPHQVVGKYFFIQKEYHLASRAFQKGVNYPNYESWNNLYYWGICENKKRNIYIATFAFANCINDIMVDPNYLNNAKKATTALYCNVLLAREKEAEITAQEIKKLYALEYKSMIEQLHSDMKTFKNYIVLIEESGFDLNLLFKLKNEIESQNIQCDYLKMQLILALTSRIVSALCQKHDYNSAISVSEQARKFDNLNPDLLYNEGSCYFFNRQYELAKNCYLLASHYELDEVKRAKYCEALKTAERYAKKSLNKD